MIAPENLLIVRTDRIGNVILSLPLAELVKSKYPSCKVTFLVREYTSSLIENNPFIDQILLFKEKKDRYYDVPVMYCSSCSSYAWKCPHCFHINSINSDTYVKRVKCQQCNKGSLTIVPSPF